MTSKNTFLERIKSIIAFIALVLVLTGCDGGYTSYEYSIVNDTDSNIEVSLAEGLKWKTQIDPLSDCGNICLSGQRPPKFETITWIYRGKQYQEKMDLSPVRNKCNGNHVDFIFILKPDGTSRLAVRQETETIFINETKKEQDVRLLSEELAQAIVSKDSGRMKELIEKGAPVSQGSYFHKNVLLLAIDKGLDDIAKELVGLGARIQSPCHCGDSALSKACYLGNIEMVNFLLGKGADINYSHGCMFPLSEAVRGSHVPVIRLLIEKGAVLDPVDKVSQTPMAYAIRQDDVEIIKILLEAGVSPDTQWAGQSYRVYAKSYGSKKAYEFLKDYTPK